MCSPLQTWLSASVLSLCRGYVHLPGNPSQEPGSPAQTLPASQPQICGQLLSMLSMKQLLNLPTTPTPCGSPNQHHLLSWWVSQPLGLSPLLLCPGPPRAFPHDLLKKTRLPPPGFLSPQQGMASNRTRASHSQVPPPVLPLRSPSSGILHLPRG